MQCFVVKKRWFGWILIRLQPGVSKSCSWSPRTCTNHYFKTSSQVPCLERHFIVWKTCLSLNILKIIRSRHSKCAHAPPPTKVRLFCDVMSVAHGFRILFLFHNNFGDMTTRDTVGHCLELAPRLENIHVHDALISYLKTITRAMQWVLGCLVRSYDVTLCNVKIIRSVIWFCL